MALTQRISIPQIALLPGVRGPFASPRLPIADVAFISVLTPIVWPAVGDVLTLIVEESPDDGVTWFFSASNTLSGGVWRNKDGTVMVSDTWSTTLMFAGDLRRIRLTVDVLQACTLAAAVSTQ